MKPTITGQKRPLEQGSYTENSGHKRHCPSKEAREVATILASLDDPRRRDLSAATQEALRFVNASLQRHCPLLDLSHVHGADIASLPTGLIHPAIHTVQTLILPSGLKRLPSFCLQLSNLQRLDIPGFAGSELDLRSLSGLRELSGSATQIFKRLFVNVLADIRFQAPDAESKIRIDRYDGDQLRQQHALPSHPYFKVLPGNAMPDFTRLNGKSYFAGTHTKIVCNSIAPDVLYRRLSPFASGWKKIGYFGITDAASLSATITEAKLQFYENALTNSGGYALVGNEKFSAWLRTQFEVMLEKEKASPTSTPANQLVRGLRVFSSNHELHFLLMIKPGPVPTFIAEMYDPNLTLTHRKMVANRLEQIIDPKKPWRLTDFISKERMTAYMRGNESAVLCFAGMDQRTPGQTVTPEFWLSESDWCHPDIMFDLVDFQLASHIRPYWQELVSQYQQKKISLSALHSVLDGHANNTVASIRDVATNCMLESNHALVADEFAACIASFAELYFLASPSEKHGLPDDAVRRLFAPIHSWSRFIAQISGKNKASLYKYFSLANRLLDKHHIPESDVLALLSAKNSEGNGAIAAALQANDVDSLRLLGTLLKTLIARGTLSANDALALIGNSSDPTTPNPTPPLIWQVCAMGSTELVHELASLLVSVGRKNSITNGHLSSLTADATPPGLPVFLLNNPDSDLAEYDPVRTKATRSYNQLPTGLTTDDSLRSSLHTMIFGDTDPEFVPSLVSGDAQRFELLGNMRQLVEMAMDHELLSILDDAGRFMIATDGMLAGTGHTGVHDSVAMTDVFHQHSESSADSNFQG
jgi:hypothetical protein